MNIWEARGWNVGDLAKALKGFFETSEGDLLEVSSFISSTGLCFKNHKRHSTHNFYNLTSENKYFCKLCQQCNNVACPALRRNDE